MNDGNSSDVGGLVRVGTGSKAASLGLQQVQQIFHEITGKTDTLSKRYQVNFKIDADDLVQLHERLRQAVEQYNVKAHNCSVTVHFIDDNRQQFQSFESFRLMSASSTACVESVHIKYDLLIIPTLTQALQTFELQIQLTSRVAAERRIEDSLDAYHPLSYIKLTRGDESEIQAAEKRTHHGIVSGTVAFFAALIEAVSAKFIVIGLLALVARV